ncbi:tetratricopeptide repeat protein [Fulvivirgaceae bacterium BMA10]|uniref:Tetratricopeptide repeat protein n=1 Tax=Splendidivirga corallicola TaxID=3051826 RepID=A0ABT8KT81_9BACT|nr:tetratricopeptide repeat protein [Fulvivirgaceae bacterium BMA10]
MGKIGKSLFASSYLIILIMVGCDTKYSQNEIYIRPELDEEYYKTALSSVNRAIENRPSSADAHYKRALLLEALSDYKSAITNARKAIELNDGKPEYYLCLARNSYLDQNIEGALKAAHQVENMQRGTAQLYRLIADLYQDQGNHSEALNYNNQLMRLSNKSSDHFQRGAILWSQGDSIKAVESLKYSIDLDSTFEQSYDKLAQIYLLTHQYDSAHQFLDKAMALDGNDIDRIFTKGEIFKQEGKRDSALTAFRKILNIDSRHIASVFEISQLFLEKYRYDSANFYANRILDLSPGDRRAKLMEARILDKRGFYNGAMQKYQELIEQDSTFNLAFQELEKLKRKVAYLRKLKEEQQAGRDLPILRPKNIKTGNSSR